MCTDHLASAQEGCGMLRQLEVRMSLAWETPTQRVNSSRSRTSKGRKLTMPPIVPPYTKAQKKVQVDQQLSFGVDEDEDMSGEVDVMPDEAAKFDE